MRYRKTSERKVIIGDTTIFAIESGITQAYEHLNFRGLGFFVIHVKGQRYGVNDADATMLACSFDEVEQRIARRGTHTALFAVEPDAGKIAAAFLSATYGEEPKQGFFGISLEEFTKLLHRNGLVWAPDGDEAFDDDSYILQFDIDDRVRVISPDALRGRRRRPSSNISPRTTSASWTRAT